jgi:hypothetical protein
MPHLPKQPTTPSSFSHAFLPNDKERGVSRFLTSLFIRLPAGQRELNSSLDRLLHVVAAACYLFQREDGPFDINSEWLTG